MNKKKVDLDAFLEDEGNAIEANPNAPITDATKVTRGGSRTRTLQVRLSPDEYEGLEKLADDRGLPVSTVAREALQRVLHTPKSAQAERLVSEFEKYVDELHSTALKCSKGQVVSAGSVWSGIASRLLSVRLQEFSETAADLRADITFPGSWVVLDPRGDIRAFSDVKEVADHE